MPFAIQHKASAALLDYVAEQLEVISAIPEGLRLAQYPTHDDDPSCWCHPRLVWSIGGVVLEHKDLHNGEFDA
jgi:hypothetical protein